VKLSPLEEMVRLDALVLAVSHKWYLDLGHEQLATMVRDGGVVVDVKSALGTPRFSRGIRYWSL
jgi:UDP-N-acetyl-D-galactosamine dehydrogenase